MLRVYSGSISSGQQVLNPRAGEKVRVNRIVALKSDEMTSMDTAQAGDICAVVGLKNLKTGDTLCALETTIVLESITAPEPVISIGIEPKTPADQEKLGECLAKMSDEDPSLHFEVDEQTGQTLMRGMGELHLEVRLESLRTDFGLSLNRGNPMVAYKEAFTSMIEHRERLVKQSGGPGQFADITFQMYPASDGVSGLDFESRIRGGKLTKEQVNSAEKGFLNAMKNGVLGGFPLEGLRVVLTDGAFHENDSSPLDFERAAMAGFKKAGLNASPVLLEPIMLIEIQTPEEYLGVVNGDINKRRGWTRSLEDQNGIKVIQAEIPLAETFGYIGDLRTITSGRGTISMSLAHYAEVPSGMVDKILK